jgi:hypothetical protein
MMRVDSKLTTSAPSRLDNPFATCWTRPGAIAFQFPDGSNRQSLVDRLAAHEWRGAIVGPHGSGKTTLLETLKLALLAAGVRVHAIALHDREHRLPRAFMRAIEPQPQARAAIVIVDGYEQLRWYERLRLARRCRRAKYGLLVTAHQLVSLPLLIRLAPDEKLVQRLVAKLAEQVSTSITRADVKASHACHGSNVRETFFELYDRHESRRRRAAG